MNVGVKSVQPLLLAELEDILPHHLIRMIVEQNINPSHSSNSRLHHLLAIRPLLQISGVQMALASILLHQRLRPLRILLFLREVGDEGVCTLHSEEDGSGATNARVAAGD